MRFFFSLILGSPHGALAARSREDRLDFFFFSCPGGLSEIMMRSFFSHLGYDLSVNVLAHIFF